MAFLICYVSEIILLVKGDRLGGAGLTGVTGLDSFN